tara:strand:- start:1103 stop:5410 length:4308 start_codon:yes stop_codon:yes gene_type:complete
MALKVGDRVRENTNSTGVGGLSLTGAPAGFQRFSSVLASGDITYYTLEENDKFEVGIGTYGSNNLERTTVLSSSNSGNKISLGGSGTVFITYPAARAVFENQNTETVIGASGIVFSDNTLLKSSKLVALSDVSLSGTPANSTIFDLNVTNKALTIGDMTGPSNNENVLVGYGAGSGITTASYNVVIGSQAAVTNKTGIKNVYVGSRSGPTASDASIAVYSSVAVGYSAGNKMRHESVAVGYESAKNSYNTGFVGLGYQAGEGLGDYSNIIGYQAGKSLGENYAIALGYRAGYNGAGESVIWIGQEAGSASTGSTKSIGIGKSAGESSSGTECIYLGEGAGTSNSTNNLIFIGNAAPSSNGTLIKGDMGNKRVAVGAADVTLSDTFFVGIGSANDEGVVVKAAVSQVSNLTSWKDSSSNVLASVSKNGTISAFDLHSTGNGIQISSITPASTSNRLYNVAGTLYFNGSQLASAGGASPTAQYASGLAITNEGRVNYASGQAIANESDIVAVSGIAAYASGVGGGGGDVTTAQLNYVSGIAVYSSGLAITNEAEVTYASGLAITNEGRVNYASGQAISNQSNITALNTASGIATSLLAVSGTATSLVATSGIATYASGQAIANEGDLVAVSGIAAYASGVSLTVKEADGSPNVSNVRTIVVSNGTLTDNGAGQVTVTTGGGGGGGGDVTTSQLNYVSGIAVYSSGQAISNQSNITALNTASGIATSLLSVSGIATSLVASSGIATYASGQAIENESDLVAVSGIANYASGQVNVTTDGTAEASKGLVLDSAKSFTGVKDGRFSQFDSFVYSTGVSVGNSGVLLSRNTPNVTTDTLYNVGGTLYFNGSQLASAGGASATAQYASGQATSLNTASGVATYASGQAIANESDIVATSGIANYASGQAISNQGNITSLLTASGTATSLIASSGIATYASGQAIANESDIVAVSGIATNKFTVTASDSNNYTFNGMGLSNGLDPDLYLHKGHTYYFDKQIAGHPFRVSATDGGSVYQDAAGNNIEISGQGVLKFEVPQNAPDKLYYYCTSHSSNMKGEIYTTNNVDEIIHVSGIAAYASGQAISNQSNITALNTASGIATSLLAVSGTATSLVASSGVATYASGNTANISFGSNAEGDILIHDGSKFTRLAKGTDNYILKMNGNLPNWEAESSGGVSGDTFATDLKIGRDSQNLVDFASTDNKIILRANNINQISLIDNVFGPEADSDVDLGTTSVRWKDAYVDSITVTGNGDIDGDLDVDGTTNLDAVDIDGNVQIDGTVTVGVDDTGKDVKFYGATSGSYLEWDESEDRLNLVGAAYVQEAVPANDTPTAEDATVTLDLKKGNFHNISLGQNVTKFEFINAKRGQRFILRITQNGSSAKTVAWTNVDYTTGGAAATVRWAGNVVPTMSTSTSHTDVYGFLCTNNAGSNFDGFIIGQDLPD